MKQKVVQKAPEKAKKPTPNLTGIPTQMKLDFERRSGLSFDDVRVHYNSDKPRKIGALAYTQIPQVHIGPGQERHLRHELVHVVQQKQGIVRPTIWINGLPVNNSLALETKATIGAIELPTYSTAQSHVDGTILGDNNLRIIQMISDAEADNIVNHFASEKFKKQVDDYICHRKKGDIDYIQRNSNVTRETLSLYEKITCFNDDLLHLILSVYWVDYSRQEKYSVFYKNLDRMHAISIVYAALDRPQEPKRGYVLTIGDKNYASAREAVRCGFMVLGTALEVLNGNKNSYAQKIQKLIREQCVNPLMIRLYNQIRLSDSGDLTKVYINPPGPSPKKKARVDAATYGKLKCDVTTIMQSLDKTRKYSIVVFDHPYAHTGSITPLETAAAPPRNAEKRKIEPSASSLLCKSLFTFGTKNKLGRVHITIRAVDRKNASCVTDYNLCNFNFFLYNIQRSQLRKHYKSKGRTKAKEGSDSIIIAPREQSLTLMYVNRNVFLSQLVCLAKRYQREKGSAQRLALEVDIQRELKEIRSKFYCPYFLRKEDTIDNICVKMADDQFDDHETIEKEVAKDRFGEHTWSMDDIPYRHIVD